MYLLLRWSLLLLFCSFFWHFVLLNEWRIYLVGFIWSLQDDQKWAHQHQQQECRISSLFKFSHFLHPKFTVYVCVVVSWLALKVFNGCKWHRKWRWNFSDEAMASFWQTGLRSVMAIASVMLMTWKDKNVLKTKFIFCNDLPMQW